MQLFSNQKGMGILDLEEDVVWPLGSYLDYRGTIMYITAGTKILRSRFDGTARLDILKL